jgi:cytochrome c biogenesis protein CcdA
MCEVCVSMNESGARGDLAVRRRARVRIGLVVAGVVLIGVAGYVGFIAFVQSDGAGGSSVLVLGALTGFAAFFSPCSFPLLLIFLSRRADESRRSALASSLRVGLGASLMLALTGLALVIVGASVGGLLEFDQPSGRVFRFLLGGALIAFGLKQSRLVGIPMGWMDSVASSAGRRFDPSRASSRAGGDMLYGFGYLLAGFG